MKYLLLIPLLLLGVGCASGTSQPFNLNTFIVQNQPGIRVFSNIAVDVAIKNAKPADQVKIAKYAYEAATAVHQAISTGNVDVSHYDALIRDLLSKLDSTQSSVVGALLQSVETYILNSIQTAIAQANTTDQQKATLALLDAAALGIQDASLKYTNATPGTVRPTVTNTPGITVRPVPWTPKP